jgi:hypothetical protein
MPWYRKTAWWLTYVGAVLSISQTSVRWRWQGAERGAVYGGELRRFGGQ